MGAELDVMKDMSKALNKRFTSMNDENQDNDEVDLFRKLVTAKLKGLPQMRKYRLKHEIKTKKVLIIMSKGQIELRARVFMLKLMSPLKMEGMTLCQFFHVKAFTMICAAETYFFQNTNCDLF